MRHVIGSHSTTVRAVSALLTLGALLGVASPAAAEPDVPQALMDKLQTRCLPKCTLCHPTMSGGENKPTNLMTIMNSPRGKGEFFANVYALNGGIPIGVDKIVAAVAKLKSAPCSTTTTSPCDSDGDGTSDYQELVQASDPDVAKDPAGSTCDGPQYGCGASIVTLPRESHDVGRAAALMALAGFGLVLARRANRR